MSQDRNATAHPLQHKYTIPEIFIGPLIALISCTLLGWVLDKIPAGKHHLANLIAPSTATAIALAWALTMCAFIYADVFAAALFKKGIKEQQYPIGFYLKQLGWLAIVTPIAQNAPSPLQLFLGLLL